MTYNILYDYIISHCRFGSRYITQYNDIVIYWNHNIIILLCLRLDSFWRPLVWNSFPAYRTGWAVYKTRSNPVRCRLCTRNPDRTNILTSTAVRRKTRWILCVFSCNRLDTRPRCLRNKKIKIFDYTAIMIILLFELYRLVTDNWPPAFLYYLVYVIKIL